MPESFIPLDQLAYAISEAIKTEEGYAAVQWAIGKQCYKISPTYRPQDEEWMKRIHELSPNGQVQLVESPKSKTSIFCQIIDVGWSPWGPAITLEVPMVGVIRLSLKKAVVGMAEIHGLVEIDGPRKNAMILPGHAEYML